jgi:cytochrome b
MTESKTKIRVWDVPVRAFHWLMVVSFAGAYITAESERWRLVHVSLGYTLGGLVAFRILWGLMGTRYARFSSFVRGPSAVMHYVKTLMAGRPEHHVGHNPAGAVAIVLMLLSSVVIVGTGWALYSDLGGKLFEELHEVAANAMLAVVSVHVVGVLIASWAHRENLVRAMVTGTKVGEPGEGIGTTWRSVGVIVLVAVLGFWWLQWSSAPAGAVG